MAARSLWKGRLGMGLVGLEVSMFKVRDERGVQFHQIHPKCGSRIQQKVFCPICQEEVQRSELCKGYEVSDGVHVLLSDEELARLPLKTIRQIEIIGFVEGEIDPILVDDVFYLAPVPPKKNATMGVNDKPFVLISQVMKRLGVSAIAKMVYREKERIVRISPYNGIMLLQTLCYATQLRDYSQIVAQKVDLTEKELGLGETLVNDMMLPELDMIEFTDEYGAALTELIDAKIKGIELAEITEVQALPAGDDLLMQLMASTEATATKPKAKAKAKGKKKVTV